MPAEVRFSSTVTQKFMRGVSGLKDGYGSLQFTDPCRARDFSAGALRSKNVLTSILMNAKGFKTVGTVIWDGAPSD